MAIYRDLREPAVVELPGMEARAQIGEHMAAGPPRHVVLPEEVPAQRRPSAAPEQRSVLRHQPESAERDQSVEQGQHQCCAQQPQPIARRHPRQHVVSDMLMFDLFGEMPFEQRPQFGFRILQYPLRQELVAQVGVHVLDAGHHRQAQLERR